MEKYSDFMNNNSENYIKIRFKNKIDNSLVEKENPDALEQEKISYKIFFDKLR